MSDVTNAAFTGSLIMDILGKGSKTSTLGTWHPIVFNVLRCMNND